MKKTPILRQLFSSKNPIGILLELKKLPYNQSRKKIIQALRHPLVRSIVVRKSMSLPREFNDLRNGKILAYENFLDGELAYFVQDILTYSREVSQFLELEEVYSNLIFQESWEDADKILSKIKNEICVSYWVIENRISIQEKLNGTEGNWKYLKEINQKSSVPYSLLFQSLFSRKAESDNTVFQYKKDIENTIKNLGSVEMQYVLFKAGYFLTDDYKDFSYILHIEGLSSIIDKYLFLIDFIIEIQVDKENIPLILNVISDIQNSGISDSRLDRIKENLNPDVEQKFELDYINVIDEYTSGNYKVFISYCQAQAKLESQLSVELLNLYVKSLIEIGSDYVRIDIGDLWNDLMRDLFNIYDKNELYHDSRENILKFYLFFPNDKRVKQLLSIVSLITGMKYKGHPLNTYYYNFSEYTILNDCFHINMSNKKFENSLSIQVRKAILDNDFSNIQSKIPETKFLIYQSRSNLINNESLDILQLELCLKNENLSNISKEEIFKLIYDSHIKSEKHFEAIKLYVEIYFQNKFLVERVKGPDLLKKIISDNYEISNISIVFPIYFHLENAEYYYQYVALDLYLNSIKVDRPSEISFTINLTKFEVFLLEEVCHIEVLNNFYLIFSTDNEVIEERINILKLLSRNDLESQEKYLEEIASLSQKIKIKEYLESSIDGKINLNFTRIKEDKVYNLENSYNRFVKLNEYTRFNELKLLDATEKVTSFLTEMKSDSSKLTDASFLSFKALFLEVVDHFLFSKEHGLDGDLSTRIRHGVLENQIRSVFMEKSLIANKNSEEKYNDVDKINNYLKEKNYDEKTIIKVQQVFKAFSKSIDDQIQTIVKNLIQIQSNNNRKKPQALFNYNFAEEYLYVMFRATSVEVNNYDDFLNTCFEAIKAHTETLLQKISSFFRLDVTHKFDQLLDQLVDELNLILPENDEFLSKIIQEINQTSTIIQREVYSIADWFKLSNNLDKTVLDFETIVKIAVESINLYSKKIDPKVHIKTNILFQHSLYYVDLLKIMLENAIKHSGVSNEELEVDIIVESEELEREGVSISNVKITIENNLKLGIKGLKDKLSKVRMGWKSDLDSVNREGGSGFQKVKRILQYDLKALDNNFDFQMKDDKLQIILSYTNRIWWKDE